MREKPYDSHVETRCKGEQMVDGLKVYITGMCRGAREKCKSNGVFFLNALAWVAKAYENKF